MNHADGKKEDTEDAIDHQDIFFERAKFRLHLTNGIARVLKTSFFSNIYKLYIRCMKQGANCGKTFRKLSYLRVHVLCFISES